jgi:hypothetical protein
MYIFCDNEECGKVSKVKIADGKPYVYLNVTDAFKIYCPHCRHPASMMPGTYDWGGEDGFERLIEGPVSSFDTIRHLEKLIVELQESNASEEETVTAINNLVPGLHLSLQNIKGLTWAQILTFIIFLITGTSCKGEKVVEIKPQQVRTEVASSKDYYKQSYPAKNAICSCNSGKLYKRCCGSNMEQAVRGNKINEIKKEVQGINLKNKK